MRLKVAIVNAFVDGQHGGNPAAVVLDAERFAGNQKQRIAEMIGLSETAFVSASAIADFKLEFFTPTRQIAHCGHATIATFCYLRQLGRIAAGDTSKETIDGRREIRVQGESAYMEQSAPRYTALTPDEEIEVQRSLELSDQDRLEGAPMSIVNTGNSFLLVAVSGPDELQSLRPDMKKVASLSERLGLIGYYVFSLQARDHERQATARMFAPYYGIDEEPATGMAAGPLACYLRDLLGLQQSEYLIEQGHLMVPASPSVISVVLERHESAISSLMAGGLSRVMGERSLVLNFADARSGKRAASSHRPGLTQA